MKKASYALLISVIVISHLLINYQILNRSRVIRVYDEAARISYGFFLYRELFPLSIGTIFEKSNYFLSIGAGQYHPHLFEVTEAVSWKMLDAMKIRDNDTVRDTNLMILVANSIFFIILITSIYGIGSLIYNRKTGLLAAFLTSVFPLIFGQSRNAMLDFPLAAMVSLSIYLILKTDGFRYVLYSILAGIALGLSQSTKESTFIFILTPLIYYFLKSYAAEKKRK